MLIYVFAVAILFVISLGIARRSFLFAPIILVATVLATSLASIFLSNELIAEFPWLAGVLGAIEEVVRCSLILILVAPAYHTRAVAGCAGLYGLLESLRFKWAEFGYLLSERFSAQSLSEVAAFRDSAGISMFSDLTAVFCTFFVHLSWMYIGAIMFRKLYVGIAIASALHFFVNTYLVVAQIDGVSSTVYYLVAAVFMLAALISLQVISRFVPQLYRSRVSKA